MADAIHRALSVTRRVLAQAAPHYSWLLAQVEVRALEGPPGLSMATDGRRIFAGPLFLEESGHTTTPEGAVPGEREATIVHEMLHMARCHPQRAERLRNRPGRRYHQLIANLAADVIVNEDMKAWRAGGLVVGDDWIHRDAMVATFQKLCDAAGAPLPEELSRPIEDATLEGLHDAMCDVLEAHQKAMERRKGPCPCCGRKAGAKGERRERGSGRSGAPGGASGEGEAGPPGKGGSGDAKEDARGASDPPDPSGSGSGERKSQGSGEGEGEGQGEGEKGSGEGPGRMGAWLTPARLQDMWNGHGPGSDLFRPRPEDLSDSALERDERAWRGRVRESASRHRGLAPGDGLARWMESDVDVARWKRALMPLLARHMTADPRENDRIPSRRTISAHAAGRPAFWESGVDPFRPGGTLVICIDSSGSVPDRLLGEFASHALAIGRAFSSPVHMVIGDTRVDLALEDVHLDHSKATEILKEGIPGRGGTRFEPLLEKAEELEGHVALYLTDGWAPFPEPPPKIPVVWAVPPGGREAGSFPYGKVLELDE